MCEEMNCEQPAAYRSLSDHHWCVGHAIANLRNHAHGLEATHAPNPSWEDATDGIPDDGMGRTMADRMRRSIADLRADADKVLTRYRPFAEV